MPETLRATGGLETPFSCMAPCIVTLPAPAHPQPLSPSHAAIATCLWHGRRNQPYACKRQDAFLASGSWTHHMPCGVWSWSDITSRNNKHLPTTYGGMRRTCTRKQMTTATEAESGGRNRLDPGSILLPAPAGRALKHCHT